MIDEITLIKFLTSQVKDLNINEGFTLWLNRVKAQQRKDTYFYYVKIFKHLSSFFEIYNIKSFHDLNNNIIYQLIAFFKAKKLSNNTINKYLQALKSVIKFLDESDIINAPNLKIEKLKYQEPQIEIVDMETVKRILDYLKSSNNHQLICAFMLILTTGIRRTELINIEIANIDLENNYIFLSHTKNGHPRNIYILEEIKPIIRKIMYRYPDQKYLFLRHNKNQQASTSNIDSYFAKIKKDLGIKTLSPHKLRHTYATYLVLNGADLNSVRLLLGHTTLAMTQKYINFQKQYLMKINRLCNPLTIFKKNNA